jgi:hypothetical protein
MPTGKIAERATVEKFEGRALVVGVGDSGKLKNWKSVYI